MVISGMLNIGRLEPVPVRDLWKHEERDFSVWLETNLDLLAETVGITLSEPKRETAAGSFACDLVCEDENGDPVIVENQLEQTNHDHLGKLLTYLSNRDARSAIWISTSPRPEHIRTIQWLNETTPTNIAFYLVKLAAYRISGAEAVAPLFTVIVGPSEESKNFGEEKKEQAERHVLRRKFWTELLEKAKQKGLKIHEQRSPGKDHWLTGAAGVRSGIGFTYLIWTKEAGVELYIDTGNVEENKRVFDSLQSHKAEVEAAFGAALSWERMDGKRGSRICYVLQNGGLKDTESWPVIQDAMIDAMDKLSRALTRHLQSFYARNGSLG